MVGRRVNPELTCPEHVQSQKVSGLDNRINFSYSVPDHKRGCFTCEDTEKKNCQCCYTTNMWNWGTPGSEIMEILFALKLVDRD